MKILTIILTVAVCLSFSCTTLAQKDTLPIQEEPDYVELIKQKYKEAEKSQTIIESWAPGMLKEYGLVLDHMEMHYTETATQKTTDGKTVVCGDLLIIGYGKTLDGDKKRVLSLRFLCHLFNKGDLEKVLTMDKKSNILLNGWNDSIVI